MRLAVSRLVRLKSFQPQPLNYRNRLAELNDSSHNSCSVMRLPSCVAVSVAKHFPTSTLKLSEQIDQAQ